MFEFLNIAPYEWSAIGTSVLCGSLVGLERQLRGKPVGVRTSSLIVLGTYLFLATAYLFEGPTVDPSRVLGQVITGIGFLGAGVMLAKDGAVVGVTSAASIWVLAAMGGMISAGYLLPSIKVALLVVAILYGVDFLEEHTKAFSRGVHAHVRRIAKLEKNQKSDSPDT